jgi:hypothetical protein
MPRTAVQAPAPPPSAVVVVAGALSWSTATGRRNQSPRTFNLGPRHASPARLLASGTAASRWPIATMTCSARSITRRSRCWRSRRRFDHLPGRRPRLLPESCADHPVVTRVDMDSDSHLRQSGPEAITTPEDLPNPPDDITSPPPGHDVRTATDASASPGFPATYEVLDVCYLA